MKRLALVTLAVVLAVAPPDAFAEHRCHTIELLPKMLANRKPLPVVSRAAGPKVLRDGFAPLPANVRMSANFAVKWGNAGTFTVAQADFLLASLEAAWVKEMETLGFTAPAGTEAFLFNVYIYQSGIAVPDTGYSTYAGVDGQGYPYVMMPPEIVGPGTKYIEDYTDVTAAHELFHTVQMAIGAYEIQANYPAYWYWEATADWISSQVWPDNPVSKEFIPNYLLAPHVGIEAVVFPSAVPGEFDPIMLHHYGAQALLLYLSEQVAPTKLIVDSWVTAAPGDDPLRVLDRLLAAHGTNIDDAFADFVARASVLDFPRKDHYAQIAAARQLYPAYDRAIAATVPNTGTDGLVAAPSATQPEPWAYNVIRMDTPAPGRLAIELDGDTTGSRGTGSTMRARVVRQFADRVEYDDLPTEGADGVLVVDVSSETTIYLVVSSQPTTKLPDETFGYRYRLDYVPEVELPDDGGCGCTSTDAPNTLVLVVVLGVLRRKRR